MNWCQISWNQLTVGSCLRHFTQTHLVIVMTGKKGSGHSESRLSKYVFFMSFVLVSLCRFPKRFIH